MLQIGGLIVICGLLTQTTALPLGPTDLAGSLTNALSNGLLSGGLLDNLKRDVPVWNTLENLGVSGNLIGDLYERLLSMNPLLGNILNVNVTNPHLLEFGLVQNPDGHRFYVTIPLDFVISINQSPVAKPLKLAVKLNITKEVIAKTNSQGKLYLVFGDCTHSPGSLKLSLPDGAGFLPIQNIDNLTGFLTNVLPNLVLSHVCPLVNSVLHNLDPTLAHDIADKLLHGLTFVIKV